MMNHHDEAATYWKAEADKFLKRRGVESRKPFLRLNIVRCAPSDVPGALACEARHDGKKCFRVPELFIHYHDSRGNINGDFVCIDHYAKRMAVLMDNYDVQEVRFDKLPSWFKKWVEATFTFTKV